jgi:chemotaxis protein methyltransferase CheR
MIQADVSPLKVWSAGCASGEEPYGLAILLKEVIGTRKIRFDIKATDISLDALQRAKEGKYHIANLKNLPPEIISKYFVKTNDAFKVSEELKQLVSFEHADILSYEIDNVNLISCRNVLIYYDKPTQELIFDKFSRAMIKNGCLIIGQDETMMGIENAKLFSCIYPRERFYTKVWQ